MKKICSEFYQAAYTTEVSEGNQTLSIEELLSSVTPIVTGRMNELLSQEITLSELQDA